MTYGPEIALRQISVRLDALGTRWALVGGLAIGARAEPRVTRDTDVAISVTNDTEAEACVTALVRDGYEIVAVVEHGPSGRMATARLGDPQAQGRLTDLLFASCGVEPEIAAEAEVVDVLPGLRIPVARIGHLMAMKLLARDDRRRPNDYDDLHALARVAESGDWELAREAVVLIHERGFDRGRDLVAALEELAGERGVTPS